MKIVLLALALLPGGLFAADPAMTDGQSNGRAWTGMKTEIKFVYLVGLADGFRQAAGELMTDLFPKPSPEAEKKAAQIVPRLLPAGSDFPNMIVALDDFYRDAENLDIPIASAARYARARIEGRDPKQLTESLHRSGATKNLPAAAWHLFSPFLIPPSGGTPGREGVPPRWQRRPAPPTRGD